MTISSEGTLFAQTPSFGNSASLEGIFNPRSIAIIDGSPQPNVTAERIIATVRQEFQAPVYVVQRANSAVSEITAYPTLAAIPGKVDLALAIAPAEAAPDVVANCVQKDVRGVILFSSGFGATADRRASCEQMRAILKNSRTRVLGPNCLGVINPQLGLNATPNLPMPLGGTVAFLGESPTLSRFVLDWSLKHIVGFSAFACLGTMLDVSWGDLIDHFGRDPHTRTIIVQISSIGDARSLMSAAREVSLDKPIVAIKAGRNDASIRAFTWPSRCVATNDDVLTAAFRRIGVLQVDTLEDLFYAADALSKQPRPQGPRLMIVSNSDAAGVMAADTAIGTGVEIAEPSATTRQQLGQLLPGDAHIDDVMGDGSTETYLQAVEVCAQDPNCDGLLVLMVPGALADPARTAESLVNVRTSTKPMLLSYLGSADTPAAQRSLVRACIPTFSSPGAAARVFQYMWRYSYDLQALYQTPSAHLDHHDVESRQAAHHLIDAAREHGLTTLSQHDLTAVLNTYGIRTLERGPEQRDLASVFRAKLGSTVIPQFGPVLMFGSADRGKGIYGDVAVGFPPLNATLAERMLEPSRFYAALRRDCPASTIEQLTSLLVRFSQLVAEQRWIKALEIDPVVISDTGVSVLSGSCSLYDAGVDERDLPRPAIRSYPTQYVSSWTMKNGQTVTIRPIRAEDEPLMVKFHEGLSDRSVYLRYFQRVKLRTRTSHERLVRVCFLDYDREFALLAELRAGETGERKIIAIATLVKIPQQNEGEVAVMVRDDYQGQGLGKELIARLVTFAKDEGLHRVVASTMMENDGMCAVFKRLGFTLKTDYDERLVDVKLQLAA